MPSIYKVAALFEKKIASNASKEIKNDVYNFCRLILQQQPNLRNIPTIINNLNLLAIYPELSTAIKDLLEDSADYYKLVIGSPGQLKINDFNNLISRLLLSFATIKGKDGISGLKKYLSESQNSQVQQYAAQLDPYITKILAAEQILNNTKNIASQMNQNLPIAQQNIAQPGQQPAAKTASKKIK